MSDYDALPYPGATYPQSHPERMATLGRLFGLQPAEVSSCRVLELGCGSGENILPLAVQFPRAQFRGIDLSEAHVALAQASIADLGLANISVERGDIGALAARLGEFDYVIVHGVYSWVPAPVRDALFEILRHSLAAHGVAFVSHNVLPGWHFRGLVREALLFHLQGVRAPAERMQQARALLDFLCDAVPADIAGYRQVFADVAASLDSEERLRSYLFHDLLAEHNEPLYLTQFVAHARAHDLRFLAEADLCDMSTALLGEKVHATLANLGDDLVKREQYMDIVRNRVFRQTLLCRGDARPADAPRAAAVATLCIACSPDRLKSREGADPLEQLAVRDGRGTMRPVSPRPLRAALLAAADAWPGALPFDELLVATRARLEGGRLGVLPREQFERDEDSLAQALLDFAQLDAVEFFTRSPPASPSAGERPRASSWARYRAGRGLSFCNLRNEPMTLSDFNRQLLCLLDGERGESELVEALLEVVRREDLVVSEAGRRLSGEDELRRVLTGRLPQLLSMLARCAMLEA